MMKNMCAERECTIISFPPVIDVNLFHLKSHRPSRVNFLMRKTSPRIHHPECTGSRWLTVPADINTTLSHLLRSESSGTLPAEQVLVTYTCTRIRGSDGTGNHWLRYSRHRRHTVQLESYRPSSKGRKEGSTTQKERRNATPPKGGGNQAAPPNRREGERCLTQRRRRKATPPNRRRKKSNTTHRRKRPSSTTQEKTGGKKSSTQQHPKKERRRNMNKSESICHSLCSCGCATAQWRVRVSRCPSRDQMCMSRQG